MTRLPRSLSKAPVDVAPLSREELGEQQRQRIVGSLTEVFAKRGYQAATVNNLIATARISVGSFYDHFESKEDCLLQVYDQIALEARRRVAAAVPASGDWVEAAYTGMRALLAFVAEDPLAARVALLEIQTAGPEAVRRYNEMLEQLAGFLRLGRKVDSFEGALPPTFEEATASGLAWLVQARLVRGETGEVDTLLREMAEVALEPYLGAKRTRQRLATLAAAPSPA